MTLWPTDPFSCRIPLTFKLVFKLNFTIVFCFNRQCGRSIHSRVVLNPINIV